MRGNRIVTWGTALVMLAALAACTRDADQASQRDRGASGERGRDGNVTISGDDDIADALTWRVPEVSLPPDALDAARKRAKLAL